MDPRVDIIGKRLEDVGRVIAVSGGKGGIGKSTVAVVMALLLSRKGYRTGLFDLDLWGPCAHVIMGASPVLPEEDKGVIPPEVKGVRFMSIVHYNEDSPLPLRKPDFNQAVLELLAVTRWGGLDFLILDMPPGMSDAALDVVRSVGKADFCVVASPSKVVMETVVRTVKMLKGSEVSLAGAIENMSGGKTPVKDRMEELEVPYWGSIPFDPSLEDALGDTERLLDTDFANSLDRMMKNLNLPEEGE